MDTLADRFGVTYTITRTPWGDKVTIYHVHWSSELVARTVLRGDQVREVLVYRLRDRRRGIASALYQRIETDLGKPLRPRRRFGGSFGIAGTGSPSPMHGQPAGNPSRVGNANRDTACSETIVPQALQHLA